MQKNLTMKQLPDQERPYEKCLKKGAASLSDAELIGVIIRTGARGEKSTDLALRILSAGPDGLLNLIRMDTEDLMKIRGIGARDLARQAAAGTLDPDAITEEMLASRLYTAGQKDPDLILRPSGEKRLSNFMLWQAAYSELVEMDVLWPDFTPADLDAAIREFNRRSRRFGGI